LNFQPQLLNTPSHLGTGVVEETSYSGPVERLIIQLTPQAPNAAPANYLRPVPVEVQESRDWLPPIVVTRPKWEVNELMLSPGDRVAVGLKDYRLLAHYPLAAEGGAKSM
jgi:hypothetical protein